MRKNRVQGTRRERSFKEIRDDAFCKNQHTCRDCPKEQECHAPGSYKGRTILGTKISTKEILQDEPH